MQSTVDCLETQLSVEYHFMKPHLIIFSILYYYLFWFFFGYFCVRNNIKKSKINT